MNSTDHEKALERVRQDRVLMLDSSASGESIDEAYKLLELLIPIAVEHTTSCASNVDYLGPGWGSDAPKCSCGQAERAEAIRKYGEEL